MDMESIISAMYFLLFFYDYSRKMWAYILKLKSEVFIEFNNLKHE
jgi:hypothetical protein